MDAFQKSRSSRLVARCSEEQAKLIIAVSKLHRFLLVLVVCLSLPSVAQANSLIDTYVAFNHKLAKALMRPYSNTLGYELSSVNVEYNNQPVSFQYQMWRVHPKSVCAPLQHRLLKYSACTEAAGQFFRETCITLTENPSDSLQYPLYKKLYCNAAASYRPVIAKVRRSDPVDEKTEQRQSCSILTVKASRTRKAEDIRERDRVCGGSS